jgi:hypothetical protein
MIAFLKADIVPYPAPSLVEKTLERRGWPMLFSAGAHRQLGLGGTGAETTGNSEETGDVTDGPDRGEAWRFVTVESLPGDLFASFFRALGFDPAL